MNKMLLSFILIVTAAQAASPQQTKKPLPPGPGIEWQGDWGSALKEATSRNVPVILTIHKDLCPHCKTMEEDTLRNARVIEMSKTFVSVVAHRDIGHGSTEAMRGRDNVMLCNDYANIPCEVHVRGWEAIRHFIDGTFLTPTTVFCDPAGKELFRREGDPGPSTMIKLMNDALAKVSGDKIPQPLWSQALQTRKEGDDALDKEDFRKAFDLYSKIGKMKGDRVKAIAQEALQKLDDKGTEAFRAALGLSDVEQKKAALRKITEDFKGLPVALEAKKDLDSLK